MKEYTKKFQFGKVAAYSTHKANLVEIKINLKIEDDKQIVFTATGNVWNASHTDVIQGGQCIDSVWNEYRNQLQDKALYYRIMDLWEKWHLNDLNAGCEHQRAEKWEDKRINPKDLPKCRSNRDERGICASWVYPLEAKGRSFVSDDDIHADGLLTKPCPKCGYKYGSEWKYRAIEPKDLREIMQLLDVSPLEQLQISRL